MPVDDLHPEYKTHLADWNKCRDASNGQRAIHSAGEIYLSKLSEQDDDEYNAYLERALFYEATGRTVEGLGGMIFRKTPVIDEKSMKEFLQDVSLDGTDLTGFAQDLTKNVLEVGRSGILVDHPTMDLETNEAGEIVKMTQAQVEAQNIRPFIKEYKAESIIFWRVGRVNNKSALVEVRLQETVEEQDTQDEFGVIHIEQIRVLEINEANQYQQRLFRKKAGSSKNEQAKYEPYGDPIISMVGGKALDIIPFVFVAADSTSPNIEEPPLMGLVNVNVSHYKTTADLEHGAHFTGLPTAVITGHTKGDEDIFRIGSTKAWVFSDPAAQARYLEFEGKGLDTLVGLLSSKEDKMASLGAQMLTPSTRKNEAEGTAEMRHMGENSVLSSISVTISEALNKALEYAALWMNVEPATVKLNTDFMAQSLTPQMMTALLQSLQAGRISPQTYFENMQRGEIIDGEKSFEDEQSELETIAPIKGE